MGAGENETDHKLTQECLVIVYGDEIPQEARLCVLYLRVVICSNNKPGIM